MKVFIRHNIAGVVLLLLTLTGNLWACSNHPKGPGEHEKWSSEIQVDKDPKTGEEKLFNDGFFGTTSEREMDSEVQPRRPEQPTERRIRIYR